MQIEKGFRWTKVSGSGSLSEPTFDSTKNPPDFQLVSLKPGESVVATMPSQNGPWRVTPFRATGMPILIECGPRRVCNMSAVDGVNYLLKMELTSGPGVTTIDFNTNPCSTTQGCNNPAVDGIFKPGTTWLSEPCRAGSCNLQNPSLNYCDKIHTGQCANSSTVFPNDGPVPSCQSINGYTTYCYSHDDKTSSPPLDAPYKVKATYRDLN